MNNNITTEDKALIVRLWNGGLSGEAIAKMLPYKPYIIKAQIREMKKDGVLDGKYGRTKEKTRAKVLELFNEGCSRKEIAQTLNLSEKTVCRAFVELGVKKKRPPHNYKKRTISERTQLIVYDISLGMCAKDIAIKHGVSRQYIHKLINKVKDYGN